MSDPWHFLNSGIQPAAFNMAMDEALLESVSRFGFPILRYYGWTEPAATFGYSQRFHDVASWTGLRPLIRRPTGGGLVPHDADWTYSLVFPPNNPWYQLKAVESYRCVHQWLQRAFARLGVQSQLAVAQQKAAPGQCFVGAEKFDLLLSGVKVAGAAQRRTKSGLLIQGSVQPRAAILRRAEWEGAMRETVSNADDVEWVVFSPDKAMERSADALAAQKYSQSWHNERR